MVGIRKIVDTGIFLAAEVNIGIFLAARSFRKAELTR